MAYAAWSVIFGETPSASKWNILGTNDALFDQPLAYSSSYYLGSGQNIAASAIANLVNIDTKEWDVSSNFNVSTHLFTCPVTGIYQASGSAEFTATAWTAAIYGLLYKNGVEARRFVGNPGNVATSGPSVQVNSKISCSAGDTLAFWLAQGVGSVEAITVSASTTWFQVEYKGPAS